MLSNGVFYDAKCLLYTCMLAKESSIPMLSNGIFYVAKYVCYIHVCLQRRAQFPCFPMMYFMMLNMSAIYMYACKGELNSHAFQCCIL